MSQRSHNSAQAAEAPARPGAACPGCGSSRVPELRTYLGIQYRKCKDCSHEFETEGVYQELCGNCGSADVPVIRTEGRVRYHKCQQCGERFKSFDREQPLTGDESTVAAQLVDDLAEAIRKTIPANPCAIHGFEVLCERFADFEHTLLNLDDCESLDFLFRFRDRLHDAMRSWPNDWTEPARAILKELEELRRSLWPAATTEKAHAKREEAGAMAGKRKPRIARDEANVRARKALKGRPPKGNKRWSYRTLAKAIGCGAGQVSELSAWQAYAESHGLKRDKGQTAPKAVSLTAGRLAKEDSAAALERLHQAELEKVVAEQRADDEADRKQYRRRPKV